MVMTTTTTTTYYFHYDQGLPSFVAGTECIFVDETYGGRITPILSDPWVRCNSRNHPWFRICTPDEMKLPEEERTKHICTPVIPKCEVSKGLEYHAIRRSALVRPEIIVWDGDRPTIPNGDYVVLKSKKDIDRSLAQANGQFRYLILDPSGTRIDAVYGRDLLSSSVSIYTRRDTWKLEKRLSKLQFREYAIDKAHPSIVLKNADANDVRALLLSHNLYPIEEDMPTDILLQGNGVPEANEW